jgi:sugar phosphate permease
MRRRLRFYGCRIVGAGAGIQALQSGLLMQAFNNYAVVLRKEFGWSSTTVAIAFAMTRAESGLLGPAQGWMIDRFGPRVVMQVGTVLFGFGLILFSQLQGLGTFYAFYLVVALGASLGGFLSITTAIVNWFERRRATALALSQSGFAIGGLMTPLVAFALTEYGWRETALVSGIIVLIVGLPLAQVIRHRPSDIGEYVDGIPPEELEELEDLDETISQVHFTTREALRTRAFWYISLGHASALLVVGAIMANLSQYLTSEQGMTLQEASFIGGALPLMQMIGQLAGGYFGDRMNKRVLTTFSMLGHSVGLLVLTYAVNDLMVWMFVPLHGLAWGIRGPLQQALRADYFGSTSFGTIMGFSSLIVMTGMIMGTLLSSIIADVTGEFRIGFTILAVASAGGSLFFLFATPPPPPDRPGPPDRIDEEPSTIDPPSTTERDTVAVPATGGD